MSEPTEVTKEFVKLANARVSCGELPLSTETFSPLAIRCPALWPAALCHREPTITDITGKDGEPGPVVLGFMASAERTFSTAATFETAVVNPWQTARIKELANMARDIATAYVNFQVDTDRDVAENCRRFYCSISCVLTAAEAKVSQLNVDQIYKMNGPKAARSFRLGTTLSDASYPLHMRAAIRQATKVPMFNNNRDRREREGDFEDDRRGHGYRGRGRGGWFARGSRGRGRGEGRGGMGTKENDVTAAVGKVA